MCVVGHNLSNFPDITVTVLALVETEAPIWHLSSSARECGVLDSDLLGRRTSQEVQINNATKGIVLKVLAIRVVNFNIHTLRAGKEDTVGTILTAVVKVHRVGSVEVGSWRGTVCITVPKLSMSVLCMAGIFIAILTHSSGVISRVQVERISGLSQTVQVGRLRQACPQAEVLCLKDQVCC